MSSIKQDRVEISLLPDKYYDITVTNSNRILAASPFPMLRSSYSKNVPSLECMLMIKRLAQSYLLCKKYWIEEVVLFSVCCWIGQQRGAGGLYETE